MHTPDTLTALAHDVRMRGRDNAVSDQDLTDLLLSTAKQIETLRALLRECITPVHAWPQYRELAQRLRAALGEQSTTTPHVKTAAEMRADAARDTSCVGAFARARPGAAK